MALRSPGPNKNTVSAPDPVNALDAEFIVLASPGVLLILSIGGEPKILYSVVVANAIDMVDL